MKILRSIIRMYLYTQYVINRTTSSGSFGKSSAKYLKNIDSSDGNILKLNILKHHVKQFNDASCSVASVVSVVNAVRDMQQNKSSEKPLTQHDILDDVKAHKWKQRMSPKGDNGKRGLPLYMLGDVVKDSFDTYKIKYKSIETVQADNKTANSVKEILLKRLKSFEEKGNCIILAHFNQGIYVKTIQLPHISPVGGYNESTGKVTMLDVDPEQTLPYEISFDRFYEGLSNNYNNVFRSFGYKNGGYIFIEL